MFDFMSELDESDNRFAGMLFARRFSGASGVAGVRRKKSEKASVQARFFRKKSRNAAVSCIKKKLLTYSPATCPAGENPAKGQNSREVSPATCRWGIYCHRCTNSLTKKYVGPTFRWGLSLGNVLPSSLPHQLFPSDILLGIDFPSDMSLAKGSKCCWGKHRML
ncbi:hypothetical protein Tco_1569818 [Tanacetum coccineum]